MYKDVSDLVDRHLADMLLARCNVCGKNNAGKIDGMPVLFQLLLQDPKNSQKRNDTPCLHGALGVSFFFFILS